MKEIDGVVVLTVAEAAQRAGLSVSTLWRYRKAGKFLEGEFESIQAGQYSGIKASSVDAWKKRVLGA